MMDGQDDLYRSSSSRNPRQKAPTTKPASAPPASNVRTTRLGTIFCTRTDPIIGTYQPIGSLFSSMSTPRRQYDLSSISTAISHHANLSVTTPAETTTEFFSVNTSTQHDYPYPVAERPTIPVTHQKSFPITRFKSLRTSSTTFISTPRRKRDLEQIYLLHLVKRLNLSPTLKTTANEIYNTYLLHLFNRLQLNLTLKTAANVI